eukprot:760156-Prymnesium_polylepis.1
MPDDLLLKPRAVSDLSRSCLSRSVLTPETTAITCGHQPSAISHSAVRTQSSVINHQSSIIRTRPSAISHQPSVGSRQSAISSQQSAIIDNHLRTRTERKWATPSGG